MCVCLRARVGIKQDSALASRPPWEPTITSLDSTLPLLGAEPASAGRFPATLVVIALVVPARMGLLVFFAAPT